MKVLKQIEQTRNYLDYIEEHVLNVEKAWQEIQDKCKDMDIVYDDFFRRCINTKVFEHDTSKLSEQELVQYRKAFYPTNEEEKYDMSSAWAHHKENNMHHWETWTSIDVNIDEWPEWKVHCTHSVVDWMAMGYKFGDTAQQYYESNKDRIKLPDYAIDFIYEIFKRLNK